MFQLQELFKLIVDENTSVLLEMRTTIETLRNQKNNKVQEGTICQAAIDEQNLYNRNDSQLNNKDQLFGEILVVFSEKRVPKKTKENGAFPLKTQQANVIPELCYKIKMPC